MNKKKKKALVELSKSLADVQMWTRSLKDIADNLISASDTTNRDVSKVLADNHCDSTLRWLTDSIDNVKMLMRILK